MKTKQVPLSQPKLDPTRWIIFIQQCRELAEQQEVKRNALRNTNNQ